MVTGEHEETPAPESGADSAAASVPETALLDAAAQAIDEARVRATPGLVATLDAAAQAIDEARELYQDRYEALEKAIREVHPYDVPEILAMPVVAGHQLYLQWLDEQLDSQNQEDS